MTLKPGLHCDISIRTSINISITNVHTCCISTRKATYASAMSSRMKPWEYRTRYVLKMAEDETLLGRVVRKPINANPGLKANWRIGFSCIKLVFFSSTAYVLCS